MCTFRLFPSLLPYDCWHSYETSQCANKLVLGLRTARRQHVPVFGLRFVLQKLTVNVVFLNETWLNSSTLDSRLFSAFPNFGMLSKNRPYSSRGGVHRMSNLNALGLCCNAFFLFILIGLCHQSPNSDSSFNQLFHYCLLAIIFFDDFIFSLIDWTARAAILSRNNVDNEVFLNDMSYVRSIRTY